eukprot:1056990-Pelagomonas_calceolata.AAC.6
MCNKRDTLNHVLRLLQNTFPTSVVVRRKQSRIEEVLESATKANQGSGILGDSGGLRQRLHSNLETQL